MGQFVLIYCTVENQNLTELWNWLPAFRAVAEHEHVHRAAKQLHVSASAVSRSLRLLEQAVGRPLFERVGRSLSITDDGRRLLQATRDAIGRLEHGLNEVREAVFDGPVAIWCPAGLATAWVLPAMVELQREHPRLVPSLHHTPTSLSKALERGELDVAFGNRPARSPRLDTVSLGKRTSGIYCGPRHPLVRKKTLHFDDLSPYRFVVPVGDSDDELTDGWPSRLARSVGLRLPSLELAIEAVGVSDALGVLPDFVLERRKHRLRRLPLSVVPPYELFALRRREGGRRDKAEIVIDAVLEQMG